MNRINLNISDVKLEIGCGDENHRRPGFVGLDVMDFGQEIVWNAEDGLPLPDNSCTEIYSSHFFEHLHPDKVVLVFNECWRLLRPGGTLQIVVPHRSHDRAYIPMHLMFYSESTFRFFTGEETKDYAEAGAVHHAIAMDHVSLWDIREMVVNERPDIHCLMTPRK